MNLSTMMLDNALTIGLRSRGARLVSVLVAAAALASASCQETLPAEGGGGSDDAPAHAVTAHTVPVTGAPDHRFRPFRGGAESAGRHLTVRSQGRGVHVTSRGGLGRDHGLADGPGLLLRLAGVSRGDEELWRIDDALSTPRPEQRVDRLFAQRAGEPVQGHRPRLFALHRR